MLSKSIHEKCVNNIENAIRYFNTAYTFAENEQKKIEYAIMIKKLKNELQELNNAK